MDFVSALAATVRSPQMTALYSMLIVAMALGIIAAIKDKTFSLGALGKFVPDKVAPAVVWIFVSALAMVSNEWSAMAGLVYAGVVVLFVKGIIGSIKTITGVDFPEPISK